MGTSDGDLELFVADAAAAAAAADTELGMEGEYGAPTFLTETIDEVDVGRDLDLDPALDRALGVEGAEASVEDKGGLVGKKL